MTGQGLDLDPESEMTMADLVVAQPALHRVFHTLGLDYCCHGHATLRSACQESGVDLDIAVEAIRSAGDQVRYDRNGWIRLGPAELCDHVEDVHHVPLHSELPELVALANKVVSVHGTRHPELQQVRRLTEEVAADFTPHLAKEERVLFPAIRSLTEGRSGFAFGSVANPIAVMTSEHETVGELLRELRRVTDRFSVPEDACTSYKLLYKRLDYLESDTHLHVFKENSVLFPAAVALEAQLAGSSTADVD